MVMPQVSFSGLNHMSVAQHKINKTVENFFKFLNASDGLELDLNSFLHSK